MSILSRLSNLFTRTGRDDNRLQQAMEHAHAKRPAEAIEIYDALIDAKGTSPTVRARALFNRALAHSMQKDDDKAIADLESVIAMPGTPENVLSAARNQIVRVRNRVQRGRDRGPVAVFRQQLSAVFWRAPHRAESWLSSRRPRAART